MLYSTRPRPVSICYARRVEYGWTSVFDTLSGRRLLQIERVWCVCALNSWRIHIGDHDWGAVCGSLHGATALEMSCHIFCSRCHQETRLREERV